MPEESELEKWARRQNESSREAEDTTACFVGLFKLVGIAVLIVVVYVIVVLVFFGGF